MVDYFLDNFKRDVPNGVKLKLPTGFTLDLTKNYKTQITEFLNNFSGFTVDGKQIDIIGVEKNFLMVVQFGDKKIIFNGIIDVVGKDNEDNYYILDHKSKKEFKDESERQEYARQLYLYSIYIKNTYGKYPVKLVFDMFRSQNLDIIDFLQDDFDKAVEWVERSVNKIESEELFLPIDFNEDLKSFEKAKGEINDLKYSFDTPKDTKTIKAKCKTIHEALKDKMFFCGNLCGHSEMCANWQATLSKYQEILNGGGND